MDAWGPPGMAVVAMSDPRPEEFIEFHDLLTDKAPEGYTPWYFRCESGSKAPDTRYGSWKADKARLSPAEATNWMNDGGNVGIAGTGNDRLVNVDIDDEDETTIGDLKPTLIARSRSRTGVHGWYFSEEPGALPNIPTDTAGEVRTQWQFVVAPGSYVAPDNPTEVPDGERDDAGYYTIERERAVTKITLDELPTVFRETHEEVERRKAEVRDGGGGGSGGSDGHHPLFDIEVHDLVNQTDSTDRWESLFHGSDTGKNTCVSTQGLLHCWRHNVSLNGYQAMVVLSGHQSCQEAGTPHTHSGAGPSRVVGDGGAMAHAWKWAKQHGHLGSDVQPPRPAMDYLVEKAAEGDIP